METIDKSQVLIFGGGFNPPTLAHQEIIRACLDMTNFEEVWVMPSGDRFDKQMDVSNDDRLAMLNLVKQDEFENDPRLQISDFEFLLPRPTQTYRTVVALAIAYSDISFWFTFGADSYHSMPRWDNGLELQSKLNMVLVKRGNTVMPQRKGLIPLYLDNCNSLSSTEARLAAANGVPLDAFVCQSVRRYIEARNLYHSV